MVAKYDVVLPKTHAKMVPQNLRLEELAMNWEGLATNWEICPSLLPYLMYFSRLTGTGYILTQGFFKRTPLSLILLEKSDFMENLHLPQCKFCQIQAPRTL